MHADPRMDDVLGAFSRGDISRQQAMRVLDLRYSELLDRIAERDLRLPRVLNDDAQRMAEIVSHLITTGRR